DAAPLVELDETCGELGIRREGRAQPLARPPIVARPDEADGARDLGPGRELEQDEAPEKAVRPREKHDAGGFLRECRRTNRCVCELDGGEPVLEREIVGSQPLRVLGPRACAAPAPARFELMQYVAERRGATEQQRNGQAHLPLSREER